MRAMDTSETREETQVASEASSKKEPQDPITSLELFERDAEGLPEVAVEARKAARQFAMLYFHLAKVLVEEFGEHRARGLIERIVFDLGIDRTEQLRAKAERLGIPHDTMDNFTDYADLALAGWVSGLGRDHCPYAQVWQTYFDEHPWFRRFAPLYCDVIDTTVAENLTRRVSHRITENVLTGADTCRHVYFDAPNVAAGWYTYGPGPESGSKPEGEQQS